jgi:hypothetical protein
MAATHGRLTGKADVCLSTPGPGGLDLTTGAAYAQLELPNGDTHALAGHRFCSGSQTPCGVRPKERS